MTDETRFCTPAQVRIQLGIPDSALSDSDANVLIGFAQAELERFTHTAFLKTQVSGTATSGDDNTLTDSGASWTADEWNSDANLVGGFMVYVYSGTGSGQCRTIIDNTTTELTVDADWTTNPDNTSKYRIFKNTYVSETFTGDDTNVYYTNHYPIFNLKSLSIDSTDITLSSLYNTSAWGKLELGSDSEKTLFSATYPLLNTLEYYYGVYPVPDIVEVYCSVQAAVMAAQYMIGSTYTFATSYTVPDLSINKGVPYPHFDKVYNTLQKKSEFYKQAILNSLFRVAVG